MADAQVALQWLRDNLGMGEHPAGSNCNALTHWAGIGCVAWCAITVSRALNEAWGDADLWQVPGVTHDYTWGIAYVPSLRVRLMAAGLYGDEPRVGAVVIYAWAPGTPIGDHTGLCEAWVDNSGRARTDAFVASEWDGTIIALEGNANDDLIRIRRSSSVIDGFGYPPYEEDDLSADAEADIRWIKASLEDLRREFVEPLSEGDEEGADPWHKGLRRRLMQVKAADVRSKETLAKLDALSKKVDKIEVGGGAVDLDALADKVFERFAELFRSTA